MLCWGCLVVLGRTDERTAAAGQVLRLLRLPETDERTAVADICSCCGAGELPRQRGRRGRKKKGTDFGNPRQLE